MKCFHFTNGERRSPESDDGIGRPATAARVSWARSLSIASSTSTTSTTTELRRSEFGGGDPAGLFFIMAQQRGDANDLRAFTFAELKSATRGFNRALLIGEGGFGSVYRGVINVRVSDVESAESKMMDVAIKQLNRYGFQACIQITCF
uniref:Protein kinase domain-containing protein n=1 Tax=Opuntia streptacantha TaxID=393608 RepID=A0A7C9DJQ9_OPUST